MFRRAAERLRAFLTPQGRTVSRNGEAQFKRASRSGSQVSRHVAPAGRIYEDGAGFAIMSPHTSVRVLSLW